MSDKKSSEDKTPFSKKTKIMLAVVGIVVIAIGGKYLVTGKVFKYGDARDHITREQVSQENQRRDKFKERMGKQQDASKKAGW
ncbi:MAG: hypothetical protein JKX83_06290 [Pseudomonadales bacterium]|nr:hypothetical protein [Pseudomonadales bacterium]